MRNRKRPIGSDPFRLTLLIFAVIAFMFFTGEVLKPLALAVLLSFALAPAARFLESCALPRRAAVILTVLISLGLLGGIGYVVGRQLTSLANRLPDYQKNIEIKLGGLINPGQQTAAGRLRDLANEVTAKIEMPHAQVNNGESVPIQKVEVISRPSIQEQLGSVAGPYLEFLGVASFVLVLVLFMLMDRDRLSDRIVGIFGNRHVTLTTRTMQEIGQRISKYLATFALVNSAFGLVIGIGLELIGVPYAVLWGCLAAMLRFIPYVGPAVAFILPLVFSFAFFSEWSKPLEVVALFAIVEAALTSFLEPMIYGKTTGISALGLLVSAMFWTWLWGSMGLLLSTPMTVCLAVLGKYVPSMWFFAELLSEEVEIEPDVKFYQRLVALDREGAIGVIETEVKRRPRVEIFDQILVPALSRAERDAANERPEDARQEFAWQVVGEILDSLEGQPDICLDSLSLAPHGRSELNGEPDNSEPVRIVGLAADDTSDSLILRMLGQVLGASGCVLEVIADTSSSLQACELVAEHPAPKLVIVSHLPPRGLTMARYLVRRLRSQLADTPILVGRWGESAGAKSAARRLAGNGASRVVFTLAAARARIVGMAVPEKRRATANAIA
jgi:predicted PurR-regulated permease PerM